MRHREGNGEQRHSQVCDEEGVESIGALRHVENGLGTGKAMWNRGAHRAVGKGE